MNEAAENVGSQAKVAKINVDDNGAAASRFGVRGIPALLIFKNGKVVEKIDAGSGIEEKLLAHVD